MASQRGSREGRLEQLTGGVQAIIAQPGGANWLMVDATPVRRRRRWHIWLAHGGLTFPQPRGRHDHHLNIPVTWIHVRLQDGILALFRY